MPGTMNEWLIAARSICTVPSGPSAMGPACELPLCGRKNPPMAARSVATSIMINASSLSRPGSVNNMAASPPAKSIRFHMCGMLSCTPIK